MAETDDAQTSHRRADPGPTDARYLEFDLTREMEQLFHQRAGAAGQNAKTLCKYEDFRVVLMALRAHTRMPTHRADGRISIQSLTGHILVRAEGRTFELRAGGLLALDRGLPHEVEALEDSAFLLTIASHAR